MTDMNEMTREEADRLNKVREERDRNAKELILAMAKGGNPLVGKSEEDMRRINDENLGYQDALREAMMAGLVMDTHPAVAFGCALAGLLIALANREQTEKVRETIGYILTLKHAVENCPQGPAILLTGELVPQVILDVRDEIPDEVRKKFNIGEGPLEGGAEIKRVGNVVDASQLFAANGGKTVH